MINKFIPYKEQSLENFNLTEYSKKIFKSKLISKEQYENIKSEFKPELYSPNLIIKLLFFFFSIIAMSTAIIPVAFIFFSIVNDYKKESVPFLCFIVGGAILGIIEFYFVRQKKHYRSGITEAGLYSGFSLVGIGICYSRSDNIYLICTVGFVFSMVGVLRYLDVLSLVASFVFLVGLAVNFSFSLGGLVQSILPFSLAILMGTTYYFTNRVERKDSRSLYNTHYLIAKVISIIMIYISLNYFVVRELSIKLMSIDLSVENDIPFAFLFYLSTALIPFVYLYHGIKKKSILFIRSSILTVLLSVITLKIYFTLGMPIVTITMAGAVMIILSVYVFKILKNKPNGFTSDKIFKEAWDSEDLMAIVTATSLDQEVPGQNGPIGGGGHFGGGGANGGF